MSRQFKGKKVYHNRDGGITIVKKLGPRRRRGGSGCFPGESRVLTPSGWKPISSFQPGDSVMSSVPGSPHLVERIVTEVRVFGKSELLAISIANSQSPVLVTPSHSFLSCRGWLRAEQLRVGDLLTLHQAAGNEVHIVSSVASSGFAESVYNLTTTEEHTFIVEGLVVHNFSYLRSLRTWLHRMTVDRRWCVPAEIFA